MTAGSAEAADGTGISHRGWRLTCLVGTHLFIGAALLPLGAQSVRAMPWSAHSDLSREAVPMASTPDEGPDGTRLAKTYFQQLDRLGYRCDVEDRPQRRLNVDCKGSGGHRLNYRGQFVGAGYLQIDRAALDGKPLSKAQMIAHQTAVYEGREQSR